MADRLDALESMQQSLQRALADAGTGGSGAPLELVAQVEAIAKEVDALKRAKAQGDADMAAVQGQFKTLEESATATATDVDAVRKLVGEHREDHVALVVRVAALEKSSASFAAAMRELDVKRQVEEIAGGIVAALVDAAGKETEAKVASMQAALRDVTGKVTTLFSTTDMDGEIGKRAQASKLIEDEAILDELGDFVKRLDGELKGHEGSLADKLAKLKRELERTLRAAIDKAMGEGGGGDTLFGGFALYVVGRGLAGSAGVAANSPPSPQEQVPVVPQAGAEEAAGEGAAGDRQRDRRAPVPPALHGLRSARAPGRRAHAQRRHEQPSHEPHSRGGLQGPRRGHRAEQASGKLRGQARDGPRPVEGRRGLVAG